MASEPLPPLPTGPVTSISDAIARMQEIEAALPPADGLADFAKVNLLLAALDPQIRQSFESGPILELDEQAAAGLENVVGNFGIDAARETAWVNAQTLWHLRGISFIYQRFLDGMDRTAAF